MPFQALAAAAALLTVAPHGNRIELRLDRGSAELLWVSPGAFRFRRTIEGELPKIAWTDREPVTVEILDGPDAVRLRTRAIEVTIQKRGVLVEVRRRNGDPLMHDASEPRPEGDGVVWERQAPAGTEFYGLGPRTDTGFALRGRSVRAEAPLLVSTGGYGEYHVGAGTYRFDFTETGRYGIQGPAVDYYFYFGATPKAIFEEHYLAHKEPVSWTVSNERYGTWAGLRASLARVVQGAMSAANAPVFELGVYDAAPEELKTRARQLGSLVAGARPGQVGLSGFRKQLGTFFGTYVAELEDRGLPLWHPLPFQFPEDAEAARHTDEFLLGDEMLVAPIVDPGNKRSVYLPRGSWTNLETNLIVKGPAVVAVETKSLPVWARNGSIVPLDSPGGMALHYYPDLGGEFFLLEEDIGQYSEAHAAPALDFLRLEIESKKDRDYQWVVHHVDKPASVGFEDRKYREVASPAELADGCWWWDAANRNLQIRVKVKAGEDCIINIRSVE